MPSDRTKHGADRGQPASDVALCMIPGDGIGREVIPVADRVLARAAARRGVTIASTYVDWGATHWRSTGRVMPDDAARQLRQFDSALFGAIGEPGLAEYTASPSVIMQLRKQLDLGVNIRPVRSWAGVPPVLARNPDIDILVVRENTEGEYSGVGGRLQSGDIDSALEINSHSRGAVTRTIRAAFAQAAGRRGQVTVAHKGNAFRAATSLWMEIVDEVAEEFPTVSRADSLIDSLVANLVSRPHSFDVVVGSNLFGDILSDLTAALTGGLGLAPSGSIEHPGGFGVFEPVHGSAPDIAGRGTANPLACVLSAAMLMDNLSFTDIAADIRDATTHALLDPSSHTPDLGGGATTADVERRLMSSLE